MESKNISTNETCVTVQFTPELIDYLRPKHSNKLCRSEAFFNLLYRLTNPVLSAQKHDAVSESADGRQTSLLLSSTFRNLSAAWQWALDTTKLFLAHLTAYDVITVTTEDNRNIIVTVTNGCATETDP